MAAYSIVLAEDAIQDIDNVVEYYNGISYGLGFEFTDTLDLYFKKIAALPTASAIRYDNVRVKPIDIFPFTIHFIISGSSTVIILRVFNTFKNLSHNKKPSAIEPTVCNKLFFTLLYVEGCHLLRLNNLSNKLSSGSLSLINS